MLLKMCNRLLMLPMLQLEAQHHHQGSLLLLQLPLLSLEAQHHHHGLLLLLLLWMLALDQIWVHQHVVLVLPQLQPDHQQGQQPSVRGCSSSPQQQ